MAQKRSQEQKKEMTEVNKNKDGNKTGVKKER